MTRSWMKTLRDAGCDRARRLWPDARGAVALEFALILPLLLLFCFATVEVGRFALLQMKLEQLAGAVADLGTRDRELAAATVDDLFAAAEHVMKPFTLGQDGLIVLSGVGAPGGGRPEILWQRRGGGEASAPPAIGSVGDPMALPPGLRVDDGQTVVVAEIVHTYRPWLLALVPGRTTVKRAYFRPRLGNLDALTDAP